MPTRTAAFAALFTSIVFTLMFTTSAFAGWFIEGEELTSTAALSTTSSADATSALLVPALKLTIVCGGSTLDATSPTLVSGSTLTAASLAFLSCNTTAPASGCALQEANQTVRTNAISALVTGGPTSPEARLLFTAKTKSTLATISFNETNTCAFNSEEPLKGSVKVKAPKFEEEQATQPLEGLGSVENNSLEIGAGNKAFIDGGKTLLGLASGAEWLFNQPNVPLMGVFRQAGTGGRKNCLFTLMAETCELRVEVLRIVGAVQLKFTGDKFIKINGNVEYTEIAPVMAPRCKKGTVIGGAGTSCYVKVEYTGINNPAVGQFISKYEAEVQENGGNNLIVTNTATLSAR